MLHYSLPQGAGRKWAPIGFVLAVNLVCTTAVLAADWALVPIAALGDAQVYLDKSSLIVDGPVRHAWFKYIIANMRNMELHVYNCKTKEVKIEESFVYLDGEKQPTPANAKPSPWFSAEPDTEHEATMKYVCKLSTQSVK